MSATGGLIESECDFSGVCLCVFTRVLVFVCLCVTVICVCVCSHRAIGVLEDLAGFLVVAHLLQTLALHAGGQGLPGGTLRPGDDRDRKSTRLNSSHL